MREGKQSMTDQRDCFDTVRDDMVGFLSEHTWHVAFTETVLNLLQNQPTVSREEIVFALRVRLSEDRRRGLDQEQALKCLEVVER